MQRNEPTDSPSSTAFSIYLRTGRRIASDDVQVKFNPWHDEQDGRFTFAGQGRYFPAGSGRGGSFGGGGATGSLSSANARRAPRAPDRTNADGVLDRSHLRPDHPDNYAIHVVQPGDSLSRIAARRNGLTARDLAWLNQQSIDQPLKIGQRIKLPNQAYLDAGRAAKNKVLALAHYIDTHGGKLPPDPANPPSIESQLLDTNWKKETKHGYDFHIDAIARPRDIVAEITDGPAAKRSRSGQVQAGGADRRPTDEGGHFIAARFNGPSDSFNHFAQDKNFNRGAYRAMEDGWSKELRAGKKVTVKIVPLYEGTSKRPYHLTVTWYVDGKQQVQDFPNEAKGKSNGRR
jgi:LysM repeat protein